MMNLLEYIGPILFITAIISYSLTGGLKIARSIL
ncbi:Uncharacterised protein [Streptococcus suis]|nr:Uncharacterised protein [Streptococcus suis]CYV29170.1 Uncharacterised protein [Streptococcus suis]